MRYLLMISLTALFLLACGDTDNPVVPTAPAGKATVDLTAEECEAAESLPDGFLEQAREVNADLDAELLLTMWKAHGCADWALWGLIWLEFLDVGPTFETNVYTPPEPEIAFQHGPPRIDEVRITNPSGGEDQFREAWATGDPVVRKAIRDQWRDHQLRQAGALSTVDVFGSKRCRTLTINGNQIKTDYAVFRFTRTDGHTDEPLTIRFGFKKERHGTVFSTGTVTSGFGAGDTFFEHREEIASGEKITVSLIAGWENDMSGNYTIGKGSQFVFYLFQPPENCDL